MDNGIRVTIEIMSWGDRTSETLKSELVDQQMSSSSSLWNGYLTKTMLEATEAPTSSPTPSPTPSPTSLPTPSPTSSQTKAKNPSAGSENTSNDPSSKALGESENLSGGSIAAITIGSIVGVVAIAFGTRMMLYRGRHKNRSHFVSSDHEHEHFNDI